MLKQALARKSTKKLFPVPEDMSVNFCWPPMGHPAECWYTMRMRDDCILKEQLQAKGISSPTHEQRLEHIENGDFLAKKIGNIIHLSAP